MTLAIPMNKAVIQRQIRRREYRKTGKARNTITKSEGPPDAGCKNQADT